MKENTKAYTEQSFLKALRVLVSQEPLAVEWDRIDWNYFRHLIGYHEINALLYSVLQQQAIILDGALREYFESAYFLSLLNVEHLWREFLVIQDALAKQGIAVLPVKGIALIFDIYADNPCRPMSDIDLLVREINMPQVKDVMAGLGYMLRLDGTTEEYWLTKQCHLAFVKETPEKTVFTDIHFGLDFKRNGQVILPRVWDRIRQLQTDDGTVSRLSPEDDFFSLVLHQRRFGRVLSLKNTVDCAYILQRYTETFDWHYIIDQAHANQLCASVYFMVLLLREFFGVAVPEHVFRRLKISTFRKANFRRYLAKNLFTAGEDTRWQYLLLHFLLYDTFREAAGYILTIPYEQFARYYRLNPQARSSRVRYAFRYAYFLYDGFRSLCTKRSATNRHASR